LRIVSDKAFFRKFATFCWVRPEFNFVGIILFSEVTDFKLLTRYKKYFSLALFHTKVRRSLWWCF